MPPHPLTNFEIQKYYQNEPATIFLIFGDALMFYHIFLSPQVKRWAVITNKHGIHQLPHELSNALRLRILGNWEILRKCLNFIEW